jgi:uncharacterized protein (DUF4415 family)
MAKMITKTSEEIRKEWTPEKIRELAKTVPSYPDDITDKDIEAGYVKEVGRGFAAYKEYINRNGRPPVNVKKIVVSIRLPSSDVKKLRAMGKGWQTRVSDYLSLSIKHGEIVSN